MSQNPHNSSVVHSQPTPGVVQQSSTQMGQQQQQHSRTNSNMSTTTISSCSDATATALGTSQNAGKTVASRIENSNEVPANLVASVAAAVQIPSMSKVGKIEFERPLFFVPNEVLSTDELLSRRDFRTSDGVLSKVAPRSLHYMSRKNSSDISKSDDDTDSSRNVFGKLTKCTAFQPVWRGAQQRLHAEINRIVGKKAGKKKKSRSLGTASMDSSLQLLTTKFEKVEINSNTSTQSMDPGESDKNGSRHQPSLSIGSSSSLQLLNGNSGPTVTPLYSCDDTALPSSADYMGNFDTREEEQRYIDTKTEQEKIFKVVPNIFGVVKCPSPASGPDDSTSWKSRMALRSEIGDCPNQSQASSISLSTWSDSEKSATGTNGWWDSTSSSSNLSKKDFQKKDGRLSSKLVRLEPTPRFLKRCNLPTTLRHPALSMQRYLPFLSDRLPTYKQVQIETQRVEFVDLHGEIEPFFCSLAIYHVEGGARGNPVSSRCSRISEFLHFDIIKDSRVEELCLSALWPKHGVDSNDKESSSLGNGTRCGVFSLPSSLQLSKMYAVLIVKKVLSDDAEIDIYHKSNSREKIDVLKYRAKAAKNCEKLNQFLVPIAFGIVDLKKAVGAENVTSPKSVNVTIPLVKYDINFSEDPIIYHLCSHQLLRRESIDNTKGGQASFVLRYFGHLGMQAIVDSLSSLAPERLVESSGEVQIRRTNYQNTLPSSSTLSQDEGDSNTHFSSITTIVTEKVENGGRVPQMSRKDTSSTYALEVLTLPMACSKSSRESLRRESRSRRNAFHFSDVELFSNTFYRNSLLCRNISLSGCPAKRNFVVKLEMRFCETATSPNVIAYPPLASLFNQRRGQHLVSSLFTSCLRSVANLDFRIDEFKINLPEKLTGNEYLVFWVYNVSTKTKRKTLSLMHSKGNSPNFAAEDPHNPDSSPMSEIFGCALLPLCPDREKAYLLENNLHHIKIQYTAKPMIVGDYPPGTLMFEKIDVDESQAASSKHSKIIKRVTSLENISKTALAKKTSTGTSSTFELPQLHVSTFSLSSVHSQNPALHQLLSNNPYIPYPLTTLREKQTFARDNLDELIDVLSNKPKLLESHMFSPMYLIEQKWKDLLAQVNRCGDLQELNSHLFRIIRQVWRRLVVGTGEPSLLWADPSANIPLRLQSFATLLFLISNVADFQSKSGLTQLDKKSKWDLDSLGNVVALALDEGELFGATNMLLEEDYYIKINEEVTFASRENQEKNSQANPIVFEHMIHRKGSTTPESLRSPDNARDFTAMLKNYAAVDTDNIVSKGGHGRRNNSSSLANIFDTPQDYSGRRRGIQGLNDSIDDIDINLQRGDLASQSSFGFNFSAGRNKFNTFGGLSGGLSSLSTINESRHSVSSIIEEADEEDEPFDVRKNTDNLSAFTNKQMRIPKVSSVESLTIDEEIIIKSPSSLASDNNEFQFSPSPVVKQMRIPRLSSSSSNDSGPTKQMRIPRISSISSDSSGGDSRPITPPKQMRIPRVSSGPSDVGSDSQLQMRMSQNSSAPSDTSKDTAANLDDEGMYAKIGKQIGEIRFQNKDMWGEEKPVGAVHTSVRRAGPGHRKRRNLCSIDLRLPAFDNLLEDEQQLEDKFFEKIELELENTSVPVTENSPPSRKASAHRRRESPGGSLDFSYTLKDSVPPLPLRDYVKRIDCLRSGISGKWWPFLYEVIIYQWTALLIEHKTDLKRGMKNDITYEIADHKRGMKNDIPYEIAISDSFDEAKEFTKNGMSITCAPFLFQIIKKSLSWRVHSVINANDSALGEWRRVSLDRNIKLELEKLISVVTDACIDSRNFENIVHLKNCVKVNDSIALFLRDLFAIVEHKQVHRLVMIYFSRFVAKGGKVWKDGKSKIGLQSSFELCKLRLNAITLFVRFADFTEANKPLMKTWEGWAFYDQTEINRRFFSKSLNQFMNLGMSAFAESNGPIGNVDIPSLQPHWLAELITDICIAASCHRDKSIQLRGSSLLHELFWSQSQEGKATGSSSTVASMYVPFIEKILCILKYIASFHAKSQLRKDVIPCVIFVLQSAPVGLLRALWRKLCKNAEGCGKNAVRYGGFGELFGKNSVNRSNLDENDDIHENLESSEGSSHNILDVYCLLNLALATMEYEGSERNTEGNVSDNLEKFETWKQDFLEREEQSFEQRKSSGVGASKINTSASRRWNAHDCSVVIISTSRYIIDEVFRALSTKLMPHSFAKHLHLKVGREENGGVKDIASSDTNDFVLEYGVDDTLVLVRAVTSLYLHILSRRQSDIVVCKALIASVEVLKLFGVKSFLVAVGDTLQHWMRVVLNQCGARRANVRVQALEFLFLLLRLIWGEYGSFTRVRTTMLAVQMEVMERIVSTATTRFYGEQRLLGLNEIFPTDAAEAALAPFWRTIDRMHQESESENVAFKSALGRLAESMKKLHTAYIAAHTLAYTKNRFKKSNTQEHDDVSIKSMSSHNTSTIGRQFLGLQVASSNEPVSHNEAVEDAFLAAADVFKPTEFPSHRVAWLRKLAGFHSSRNKFGEQATCRLHIYETLKEAAEHFDCLWNTSPFLPWAEDSDELRAHGEGPADIDMIEEHNYHDDNNIMTSSDRFEQQEGYRKMFYRVASSMRDWDASNKYVFYGVCNPAEYSGSETLPWISLKSIEEEMTEEIQKAGDLFLRANIPDFARKCWSIAADIHAKTFNFIRLSYSYIRLSQVVSSYVPIVDESNRIEMSSHFGRFYRVWFHGSAPDELNGKEFVYRTHVAIRIEEFSRNVASVLKSLLPDGTPIDLVLDDGRSEYIPGSIRNHNALIREKRPSQRRPMDHVSAGLQPMRNVGVCQIKITPLRPMLLNEVSVRGSLDWFYKRTMIGASFEQKEKREERKLNSTLNITEDPGIPKRHNRLRSMAGSSCNFMSSSALGMTVDDSRASTMHPLGNDLGGGVDVFTFTQPKQVDRRRGARDFLRTPGDYAEKSLKVTKLYVNKSFPTFVSRQKVIDRRVVYQSAIEAGVEAICSWCSVLFRTVVAINGNAILRGFEPTINIGNDAIKVVKACMFSAKVKEMAHALLNKENNTSGVNGSSAPSYSRYSRNRLSLDDVNKFQTQLARGIVMFMELLHLLVVRNKISTEKARRTAKLRNLDQQDGLQNDAREKMKNAFGIHLEFERSFIRIAKGVTPLIHDTIPKETPKWLKASCSDQYFSSREYLNANIAMNEELPFDDRVRSAYQFDNSDAISVASLSTIHTVMNSRNLPLGPRSVHSFGVRSVDGRVRNTTSTVNFDARSVSTAQTFEN